MKPAMISFMGLDGSGKSTSIDYAYEQLKKRGYKVEIVRAKCKTVRHDALYAGIASSQPANS